MTRDFLLNAPYESEINYFNQALLWAAFIPFIPQGKTNISGCDAERTQRKRRGENVEETRRETWKERGKGRGRNAEESAEDDGTGFTSGHLFT